jgi:DNA-binding beta-propeller fold protein YncE
MKVQTKFNGRLLSSLRRGRDLRFAAGLLLSAGVMTACHHSSSGTPFVATVSTFAGTAGTQGHADGTGPAASFYFPLGLADDGSGNLYVADTFNNLVRKITPAAAVSTFPPAAAEDQTDISLQFEGPHGVAADGQGNVFVANTGSETILRIAPDGTVTLLAGVLNTIGHDDGPGSQATFNAPWDLTVDGAGNVYVADAGNNSIRRIQAGSGDVTTLAGGGAAGNESGYANGSGAQALFNSPYGVAADAAGDVFVADSANQVIRRIGTDGQVTTVAGTQGVSGASDNANGYAATFDTPEGVAVDPGGTVLYVTDTINNTVRRVDPASGMVVTLTGVADQSGATDGPLAQALFFNPVGIVIDAAGNLYVSDSANDTIRKVTLVP